MKRKNIFIALITILTVCVCVFSGCGYKNNLMKDKEAEKMLIEIGVNGNFVIQQAYLFSQNGKQIDFSEVAKDYANDQVGEAYKFSNYKYLVSGDVVCFAFNFYQKDAVNKKTILCRVNAENPFEYELFETERYHDTAICEIDGNCIVFLNSTRNATFYNFYTWNKGEIINPKPAASNFYTPYYTMANVNKHVYYYSKEYDENRQTYYKYVFVDKSLNYYEVDKIYAQATFITGSCVLFSDGIWYNYVMGKVVESQEGLEPLNKKYEKYQAEQKKNSEPLARTFLYNGKTYVWENEWKIGQTTYQSNLVIRNLESNVKYTFNYDSFENICPQIYKVYPSLPFAQVFVQNEELFVVCARYGINEKLCSNKLVFKYNSQNKQLEYVGCGFENEEYIHNVFF